MSRKMQWQDWRRWCFSGKAPAGLLVTLRSSGDIQDYPELYSLIGTPQNPEYHPEGDVWNHTLQVVNWAHIVADREVLNNDERLILYFSALCHDMGKPVTTVIGESGLPRSPGHAKVGVEYATSFLDRIGAPEWLIANVCCMTEHHMHHKNYWHETPPVSIRKAVEGLIDKAVDLDMLALVAECDNNGRVGPSGKHIYDHGTPYGMRLILAVRDDVIRRRNLPPKPKPILTGKWLIDKGLDAQRLGRIKVEVGDAQVSPFGHIIQMAYDAQIEGEFDDIAGAERWFYKALRANGFGFDPFEI